MSTISVCKANITKAVRALEVAKRKIPEYLLDHSDVQVDHLEELKDTIHAHIAELRQAVRTVKERQQSFIAVVSNSSNLEADSEEYVNYIENMKIEDTLVRTETVISALRRQMEEVLSLLTDQSQDKLGEITADQPPICGGDELVQVLGTANAAGPGKTKERQPFESQASYPPRIQAASQSIGAIPRQQAISPIQLGAFVLGIHAMTAPTQNAGGAEETITRSSARSSPTDTSLLEIEKILGPVATTATAFQGTATLQGAPLEEGINLGARLESDIVHTHQIPLVVVSGNPIHASPLGPHVGNATVTALSKGDHVLLIHHSHNLLL
ncbi:hypothetical protein Q1695_008199 [Nippostrongylus brasiliensis]|nr:hypothetical protein Q1695_008199 [Nippostrongylus brasiliensis]